MLTLEEMSGALPLSPDRALADPTEDRLGYAPFAKQLAYSVLRGCPADGLVVALHGAWGTGKSTALNFILHYVENDPDEDIAPLIVRFNPWWFAGHEDLVRRFFQQFVAAFSKTKATKQSLVKKLSAFSSVVSELPIPYAGSLGKTAKAALNAVEKADVVELKAELVALLASDARRVIVVVDDIDRLAAEEIRQLFQVIKAVADFPNVIYLLAFDQDAVVAALEASGTANGADYLEKIVQVPFALPPADSVQLQGMLVERLNRIIADTPSELCDQADWWNVYLDGIEPLIRKPRDVARLMNALSVTYPAVTGEVNAVDFIALETLRLFAPTAYDAIRASPEMFAGIGNRFGRGNLQAEQQFHNAWVNTVVNERDAVKKLVTRTFPRLQSVWSNTVFSDSSTVAWRKGLRACSPEVLPVYFRLTVTPGEVPAALVRATLADAADAKAFSKRLLDLTRERRADGHTRATSLLTRLRDYAEKDIPEAAIPTVLDALFDAGDELVRAGKPTTSPLDLGDEFRVGALVHILLRRLPKEHRASVLKPIFSERAGLVTMVRELVYLGGQHGKWGRNAANEEERLLQVDEVGALEQIALVRVRAAGADGSLWVSFAPPALLDTWSMFGDRDEVREFVRRRIEGDKELLSFLRYFVGKLHTTPITDRVGRTTLQLDPERVAEFADVELIAKRVDTFLTKSELSTDDRALLNAFVRGRKARERGEDPRRLDSDDDDEA